MPAILLATVAVAAPPGPLPHAGERPIERWYYDVAGDGPAYGRWLNARGPFDAWVVAGAQVVRWRRYDALGKVSLEAQYDGDGPMFAVVHETAGKPVSVDVSGVHPSPVDVSGWVARALASTDGKVTVNLLAPETSTSTAEGVAWTDGDASFRARLVDGPADVYGDGFREGIVDGCGCDAVDRTAGWVDGRPGVRYTLRVAHPEHAMIAEVAAFALGTGRLELAWQAPEPADVADDTRVLAVGRAIAALVTVQERR